MASIQMLKLMHLKKETMVNKGHKYFLNVMLSTLDERLKDIEIEYTNPNDKYVALRTILEQISEQYKKSQR
jgi:hypothetical protein